jgi:hypothetical protein
MFSENVPVKAHLLLLPIILTKEGFCDKTPAGWQGFIKFAWTVKLL